MQPHITPNKIDDISYLDAHIEYIGALPNHKIRLIRKTDSGIEKTKYYAILQSICDKYNIPLEEESYYETHWRLTNNDFTQRLCNFCNLPVGFVSGNFRNYCSTKCSALARDNNTRAGFVTEEGRKKATQTLYDKIGVPYAMQDTKIFEQQQRNRYKSYEVISPTNKIYIVQGYERYIIPLLWETYHEEDLVVAKKDIPKIQYKDHDNTIRKYYPDGYIISENRLIEVKSTYTIKDTKLQYKIKGAIDSGFQISIFLYDKGRVTRHDYT